MLFSLCFWSLKYTILLHRGRSIASYYFFLFLYCSGFTCRHMDRFSSGWMVRLITCGVISLLSYFFPFISNWCVAKSRWIRSGSLSSFAFSPFFLEIIPKMFHFLLFLPVLFFYVLWCIGRRISAHTLYTLFLLHVEHWGIWYYCSVLPVVPNFLRIYHSLWFLKMQLKYSLNTILCAVFRWSCFLSCFALLFIINLIKMKFSLQLRSFL